MKNIDLPVNVIILSNAEMPEEDLNCLVCEKIIMEQDGGSDSVEGDVVFCFFYESQKCQPLAQTCLDGLRNASLYIHGVNFRPMHSM